MHISGRHCERQEESGSETGYLVAHFAIGVIEPPAHQFILQADGIVRLTAEDLEVACGILH